MKNEEVRMKKGVGKGGRFGLFVRTGLTFGGIVCILGHVSYEGVTGMSEEKIFALQWPCMVYPKGVKFSDAFIDLNNPRCHYFCSCGGGRFSCLKGNFPEQSDFELISWMKTHRCPTIDEDNRNKLISDSAKTQADSAKAVARWSKISTLIVFLWLVVAILNLIFPNGFSSRTHDRKAQQSDSTITLGSK